ncbi:hypothetical protein LguiB_027177 [Lonicera macranthoides]
MSHQFVWAEESALDQEAIFPERPLIDYFERNRTFVESQKDFMQFSKYSNGSGFIPVERAWDLICLFGRICDVIRLSGRKCESKRALLERLIAIAIFG